MTQDGGRDDQAQRLISELRPCDVPRRHVGRLRRDCHAVLQAPSRRRRSSDGSYRTLWRTVIAPALGGAWCLAYLVEIIRFVAAVYGP